MSEIKGLCNLVEQYKHPHYMNLKDYSSLLQFGCIIITITFVFFGHHLFSGGQIIIQVVKKKKKQTV